MINFKNYLLLENHFYPWQVKTKEELLQLPNWISSSTLIDPNYVSYVNSMGNICIEGNFENGVLHLLPASSFDMNDDLFVEYDGKNYFPCKISGHIDDFNPGGQPLNSLIGLEDTEIDKVNLGWHNNIKDLNGFPKSVGILSIPNSFPIEYDLYKHVKELNEIVILDSEIGYKGLLSCFKIKNFETISLTFFNDNPRMKKLVSIIRSHLEGDRNILKCQKELIQNGFKDYAKF